MQLTSLIMLVSFLTQLESAAAGLGVSLEDACAQEGISSTTLYRWRAGKAACREDTARKVLSRMEKIAHGKGQPAP